MITLDFETEKIDGNPLINPPKPVGLAVHQENTGPLYFTDWKVMHSAYCLALSSGEPLLFHNAPFDLSVGRKWFGVPFPSWDRVHDTMYSIFMMNPYARNLSLKPSADTYLDMPPQEEDELHSWILAHVPKATRKNAGAYISLAPEELVRPYAIGDVIRTRKLHDLLHPQIPQGAYDRERELMPILVDGTIRGIRIDGEMLERDIEKYTAEFNRCEGEIYAALGGEFDIGSGPQLSERLISADLLTEIRRTPKGRVSTSKANLMETIKDPALYKLLAYRSSLSTCLGTFMRPWLAAAQGDGRVHPEWNQVRDSDKRGGVGTKTGRLSSSGPNFQNVPNEYEQEIPEGCSELPMMRRYCLPEEGHVWGMRDFSSQEIRWLAHFEDGDLLREYQDNPALDPHKLANDLMDKVTGKHFDRKPVKRTAFAVCYGSGAPGLAKQLGLSDHEGYELKNGYLRAFPAVKALQKETSTRGRSGECITTWGGRRYFREPHPSMDFSYKLLNYLIQGSAADQTKQCIIDWHKVSSDSSFLATVHDEINVSMPEGDWEKSMDDLRSAMDQPISDCPMRSEGFVGPDWGSIEKVKG